MQKIRLLGAATAAALAAAVPLSLGAVAAEPVTGVGSGIVASTVLGVELGTDGELLAIRVLGNDSSSTNDGEATTSNGLSPLTVTSKTVPGLDLAIPPVTTSSSGDEDAERVEPDAIDTPAVSGAVNAVLSSIVDATSARSGLQAGLANLSLAGGLVSVPTGAVQMATEAATASSSGAETITIPAVNVLELDALLEGLGLSLADLPVEDLLGLLDGLGLDLPDIADPAAVVADLNEAIDALQGETGAVTAELCATVDGLLDTVGGLTGLPDLDTIVGDLPLPGTDTGSLPVLPTEPILPGSPVVIPPIDTITGVLGAGYSAAALPDDISCANITATAEELLDSVQGLLADTLVGVLATLDGAPLLSVTDVEVSLVSKATDTVEGSVADVTASIGSVQVGALAPVLTDLDLTAPVAVLNDLTAQVNDQLGAILATINADLADLVDVEVLQIVESITEDGDVTDAVAEVVALRATITPPDVVGAAALLDLAAPVTDVLDELGATVPVLSVVMGELEAALGGVEALAGPSTVTVASIQSASQFRPVAAQAAPPSPTSPTPSAGPTPAAQLPRTGSESVPAAAVAALLVGAALGIRHLSRKSEVTTSD